MPISEFINLPLSSCLEAKFTFLITGIIVCNPSTAYAQIIPDRTLPNNSTVTNNSNTVEINGGTVKGTNLFHSFSEFSINPDNLSNAIDTAYFNNANDITAIFSRVTGNFISEINGLIEANGSADLFLINPNGIIFGENASLDIGGSFISSTADSIQFAGDKEFSAVNPQANPLLTVNIPVGLQYGEQPQDISVLGLGNQLTFNSNNHTIDRQNRPVGLEVLAHKTLALIGGNVFLAGGNLTAPQGNIELGSVGSNQTVGLNLRTTGWELNYAAANSFGEINLSEAASIEVSGDSGGNVRLRGDSVSLTEGSTILTDTSLDGSDILIKSDSLSIFDGGIYLNTNGVGDGGNLTINAQEIELVGIDSGFFSIVAEDAAGNGANINLHTNRLAIQDGAQIALNTLGLGNGGNLTINAREINLINDSGIFAHAITDIGNGGDIAIATDTLTIQNGAKIYAGNFADNIENSNPDVLNTLQTSPNSISYTIIGTGEVGNIDIDASSIVLDSENESSSSISSSTYTQGGGIIQVNSETISIANDSQISTETKGYSHGGGIYLAADTLHLHSGGKVSTNTLAVGNAGKIIVETNGVIANGDNSGIFSQGNINASGNVGNIGITGDVINFSDGSRIDATNLGLGKDGAISIEANALNLAEETVITNIDHKNEQLRNIIVAASRINSNQPINAIKLSQTINNPTELTVSTCATQQNESIAINKIFNSISTGINLKFWGSSTETVASQNLARIYQQEPITDNSITEAKSWIVNSEGKIELLAHSCSS